MSIEKLSFSSICDNIIEKNKLGHAYLIKTDNSYDRKYILEFIKKIISKYDIADAEKEKKYYQIDNNTFTDLIVIEPDGMYIKKDQILDLEEKFKTKEDIGQKRFYIIEFAENLNDSAMNSILKFLEEPESDIIAFLISKNIDILKPTIISRCQSILLINNSFNLDDNEIGVKADKLIEILLKYKNKSTAYLYDFYKEDAKNLIKIFDYVVFKINNLKNDKNEEILDLIYYIENAIFLLKNNVNIRVVFDKLIYNVYGVI